MWTATKLIHSVGMIAKQASNHRSQEACKMGPEKTGKSEFNVKPHCQENITLLHKSISHNDR